MLRLRSCLVSQLLSPPSTFLVSHHHRLLSATAPPVSPKPGFAAEDYLVDSCGLTRPQAIEASRQLSHLKSSSKPDAVLAFLAGRGFSSADVAATVAKYPKLLCSGKFICPHKEAAPHLAEDYETACRGELPTRFRFT
uniref:Uncharacterized protein n=1 Tax=Avena sativa TaxID=4498 RepID=A0ACD5ZLS6_AVESA